VLTRIIFSHLRVSKKNLLVLALIERIRADRALISELKPVLTELSVLSKPENGKVALAARQLLISAQQPSYDSRRNQVLPYSFWTVALLIVQVESMFLSAVDHGGSGSFNPEALERLITS